MEVFIVPFLLHPLKTDHIVLCFRREPLFKDRKDAGEKLSERLKSYKDDDVIILGIPRGGIIVAERVSSELNKPLEIIVPKKIRAPFNKEVAIGAVAQDGTLYLNNEVIKYFKISDRYIQEEVQIQEEEIKRRLKLYRGDDKFPKVSGKTVIIVDDGIATGYKY
jgi:predicted phosphoribosyltransferase